MEESLRLLVADGQAVAALLPGKCACKAKCTSRGRLCNDSQFVQKRGCKIWWTYCHWVSLTQEYHMSCFAKTRACGCQSCYYYLEGFEP